MSGYSFMNDQLSRRTSIFGLHLWVVLGICVGAAIVLFLFLISLWFTSRRNNSKKNGLKSASSLTIPSVSKEIQEIRIDPSRHSNPDPNPKQQQQLGLNPEAAPESELIMVLHQGEESPAGGRNRIHIEIGKDHRISYPDRISGSGHGSAESRSDDQGAAMVVPEVSHLGWGHWYTLRELEESTNWFAPENVIGEGGYGIVYRGVFGDKTTVAVKNLLNNRYAVVSTVLIMSVNMRYVL